MLALREAAAAAPPGATLWGVDGGVTLAECAASAIPSPDAGALAGRRVLIGVGSQLAAARALIDLDGSAAALLLCPPDLADAHRSAVAKAAGIDTIVSDEPERWRMLGMPVIEPAPQSARRPDASGRGPRQRNDAVSTDWLLLTSGTSGAPKIVAHSPASLTAAIRAEPTPSCPPFWGTFYDIRRYGGLQIFLRALLGGGSLVLSDPAEPLAAHLARMARLGVTHVSGTPSHWRKVLAGAPVPGFAPATIRLSGEIADQAVLDGLRRAFPDAAIGHAYASTEAGVGFLVDDGSEGFPAALVDDPSARVGLRVADGALQIRSDGAARAFVGETTPLRDADGFVDTGDMVELRGDRYHFVGRRGGIINVGGLKVHPEEVEAVISRHPDVRMARVGSRRSPILGAVITAEIVLDPACDPARAPMIRDEIGAACRLALDPHKRPAVIAVVDALAMTGAGKLARSYA